MARRIKYRTECFYCRRMTEPNKGWLQRVDGRWKCQCDECYAKREAPPLDRRENGQGA